MPPIVSEILKFNVAPGFKLDSPAFAQLRKTVVANGVKEQYYGTSVDSPSVLFWVIQWLANKGPLELPEFRKAVNALDVNGKPSSSYLPFAHDSLPRPALTAPLCELCFLHVSSKADKKSLAHSLEKTYTDCYFGDGFVGGHWSTASNDDNMYYYYIGWESRAHHTAFTKTEHFTVELNILMPHMDDSGFAFIKMTQQLD